MEENKAKNKRILLIWAVISFAVLISAAVICIIAGINEAPKPQEKQDGDQWYLLLVNDENPIPNGYYPVLAETEKGYEVDERIKAPLEEMLSAARRVGLIPRISEAFRSEEEQQQLFDDKIQELISQGASEDEAQAQAQDWVALPGTSEHHTGLAVDISTEDWEKQNAHDIWDWLEENSWKYGFILRYTQEHQHITGYNPERWHFRYVGVTAAEAIYENQICLEQYLRLIEVFSETYTIAE